MANELALLGAGKSGGGVGGGSSGPAFPGTVANDAGVGTALWLTPENAQVNDASDAETALSFAVQSQYLKLSGFGFSVPGGATVVGVKVVIASANSTLDSAFTGKVARLLVGGVVSGDNKGAQWDLQFLDTLGGDADLWGLGLTPAQVNASDFGVVLSVTGNLGRGLATARVNYVTVEVFYV